MTIPGAISITDYTHFKDNHMHSMQKLTYLGPYLILPIEWHYLLTIPIKHVLSIRFCLYW